jgi:hypothetical protein
VHEAFMRLLLVEIVRMKQSGDHIPLSPALRELSKELRSRHGPGTPPRAASGEGRSRNGHISNGQSAPPSIPTAARAIPPSPPKGNQARDAHPSAENARRSGHLAAQFENLTLDQASAGPSWLAWTKEEISLRQVGKLQKAELEDASRHLPPT